MIQKVFVNPSSTKKDMKRIRPKRVIMSVLFNSSLLLKYPILCIIIFPLKDLGWPEKNQNYQKENNNIG